MSAGGWVQGAGHDWKSKRALEPCAASMACIVCCTRPVQAQRRGHLDDLPKSAAPLEPFEFCETSSGNGRQQQANLATPPPQPTAGPLPAAPRSALLAQLAAGAGRPANTASTPLPPGTPPAGSGGGSLYAPSAAQQQQQQPKQAEESKPEKKKKKHGRLWRLMYGEYEGNGMHQPLW